MKTKGHAWTKKQVESAKNPNYSKLYIAEPALMGLLGNVHGKSVLEIGCGTGYWLEKIVAKGATGTGYDISENQIRAAQERPSGKNITYFVADATKKTTLKANTFDIILLEHVLLEVPDGTKMKKIFSEAHRLLKPGGHIIVSDIHPLAPNMRFPNIEIEPTYSYFSSGAPFKIISTKPDGSVTKYVDFHWTFEDIVGAITESGMKIVTIIEPHPDAKTVKKYPYLAYRKDKPLSVMIKAEK